MVADDAEHVLRVRLVAGEGAELLRHLAEVSYETPVMIAVRLPAMARPASES